MVIEKGRVADAPKILATVNAFAARGLMLPRSLNDVYRNLRDFYVCREDGEIVGCAALTIGWGGLGEIRSVAVNAENHRKGIGKALVEKCLEEARQLGMEQVFVLTYVPDFFAIFGFVECSKDDLPHKVWADCLNCPKFPDCDEIAMIMKL